MARPGLTQHRKFKRLARDLGSTIMARGVLELIWDTCYEAGDDYLGSDDDVELAAEWTGEHGALAAALANAGGEGNVGFIEPDPNRPGWRVHDLFENAPDYVQKRMMRELARKQRGETISSLRAEAGRKGRKVQLEAKSHESGQTSDTCPANGGQTAANGATPAPAPAPAPAPSPIDDAYASSCAEPDEPAAAPADESTVTLTLPCVGKGPKEWPVTENVMAQWQEAFPGVDPLNEARRMKLWLDGNPTRRKTFTGMPRFCLSWLGRAQDRAHPTTPQGGPHGGTRPTAHHHRSESDERYLRLNQIGTKPSTVPEVPGGGVSGGPPPLDF